MHQCILYPKWYDVCVPDGRVRIITNPFYIQGGMMSVFLMGVYDASSGKYRTVAKCGNGHDDATILRLQDELDMVKISKVSLSSQ